MKIIISPAKQMRQEGISLGYEGLPELLSETQQILARLRELSYAELKAVWKTSDALTQESYDQLQAITLEAGLTPALLSYVGIQYKAMASRVLTAADYTYLQDHLRIISGFYGILRPLDGICPYRLEMAAKLSVGGAKNLYDFWGAKIADAVCGGAGGVVGGRGDGVVLNLASKEYSRAVEAHLPAETRMVTAVFGQMHAGKVVQRATLAKMARGEAVRFLAERQAEDPRQLQAFDRMDFAYAPELSNTDTYVFVQQPKDK